MIKQDKYKNNSIYIEGFHNGFSEGFEVAQKHFIEEFYNDLKYYRTANITTEDIVRRFEWKYVNNFQKEKSFKALISNKI